jgi:hypothetical protein
MEEIMNKEDNCHDSLEKIEAIAKALQPLGYRVIGFDDLMEHPLDDRTRGLEIRLAGPFPQE